MCGQIKLFLLYLIKQYNYIYNITCSGNQNIQQQVYTNLPATVKNVNAHGQRLEDNHQK